MATYRALYKCRMCGEYFRNGPSVDVEIADRCMTWLHVGVHGGGSEEPNLTATHHCGGEYPGIALGLADFQGWKKEE